MSFATPNEIAGVTASQTKMEGRLIGLEKEVAELKSLLKASLAARG